MHAYLRHRPRRAAAQNPETAIGQVGLDAAGIEARIDPIEHTMKKMIGKTLEHASHSDGLFPGAALRLNIHEAVFETPARSGQAKTHSPPRVARIAASARSRASRWPILFSG